MVPSGSSPEWHAAGLGSRPSDDLGVDARFFETAYYVSGIAFNGLASRFDIPADSFSKNDLPNFVFVNRLQ